MQELYTIRKQYLQSSEKRGKHWIWLENYKYSLGLKLDSTYGGGGECGIIEVGKITIE
jgi:hypothetical protein